MKKQLLKEVWKNNRQISKEALDLLLQLENPVQQLTKLLSGIDESVIVISPELINSNVSTSITNNSDLIRTPEVEIIQNHTTTTHVKGINEFTEFYNSRYSYFRKVLLPRVENTLSITHIKKLKKEKASLIAMVVDISESQKGNMMITIEDPTGDMKVLACKESSIAQAKELLLDEVVGFSGSMGDGIFFVEEICWPDIPITGVPKKLKDDVYCVFISDIHFGSKKFLKDDFEKFIAWLNGDLGDAVQKEIARKVGYVSIAGDVVDGVGVYPSQKDELTIQDIKSQYAEAAKYISKIPNHIQIIICPGNHDYCRYAQPQPPIPIEVAPQLYALENVTMISNPGQVAIHPFDSGGLKLLLYHGTSIDQLVAGSPQFKDGYKFPEKPLQALLKRRHLAPMYSSRLVPQEHDALIIDPIPDILHTGHVHHTGVATYRGVTVLNSGTWQGKTEFQELCGHEPTPSNLPILNLKSRDMMMLDFSNL